MPRNDCKISARLGRFLAVCTSISPPPPSQLVPPDFMPSAAAFQECFRRSYGKFHLSIAPSPQDEFQGRKDDLKARKCPPLLISLHNHFQNTMGMVETKLYRRRMETGNSSSFLCCRIASRTRPTGSLSSICASPASPPPSPDHPASEGRPKAGR